MTHISRARRERGAKLVVVDAYQSPTAEVADEVFCLFSQELMVLLRLL